MWIQKGLMTNRVMLFVNGRQFFIVLRLHKLILCIHHPRWWNYILSILTVIRKTHTKNSSYSQITGWERERERLETWEQDWRDWNLWSSGISLWERELLTVCCGSGSLLLGLMGRSGCKASKWALISSAILDCSSASKISSLRLGFVLVDCAIVVVYVVLQFLSTKPYAKFGGDCYIRAETECRGRKDTENDEWRQIVTQQYDMIRTPRKRNHGPSNGLQKFYDTSVLS